MDVYDYPMLFITLIVTSFLLVKSVKKLYFIFYIPLGYIINCILGNLIGFTFNMYIKKYWEQEKENGVFF